MTTTVPVFHFHCLWTSGAGSRGSASLPVATASASSSWPPPFHGRCLRSDGRRLADNRSMQNETQARATAEFVSETNPTLFRSALVTACRLRQLGEFQSGIDDPPPSKIQGRPPTPLNHRLGRDWPGI